MNYLLKPHALQLNFENVAVFKVAPCEVFLFYPDCMLQYNENNSVEKIQKKNRILKHIQY